MIEVMMHTAFTHGTERIVRFFFELYFDEFKLPTNYTVHHYMISALGKPYNPASFHQTTHFELLRSTQSSRASTMIDSKENFDEMLYVEEFLQNSAKEKSDA